MGFNHVKELSDQMNPDHISTFQLKNGESSLTEENGKC